MKKTSSDPVAIKFVLSGGKLHVAKGRGEWFSGIYHHGELTEDWDWGNEGGYILQDGQVWMQDVRPGDLLFYKYPTDYELQLVTEVFPDYKRIVTAEDDEDLGLEAYGATEPGPYSGHYRHLIAFGYVDGQIYYGRNHPDIVQKLIEYNPIPDYGFDPGDPSTHGPYDELAAKPQLWGWIIEDPSGQQYIWWDSDFFDFYQNSFLGDAATRAVAKEYPNIQQLSVSQQEAFDRRDARFAHFLVEAATAEEVRDLILRTDLDPNSKWAQNNEKMYFIATTLLDMLVRDYPDSKWMWRWLISRVKKWETESDTNLRYYYERYLEETDPGQAGMISQTPIHVLTTQAARLTKAFELAKAYNRKFDIQQFNTVGEASTAAEELLEELETLEELKTDPWEGEKVQQFANGWSMWQIETDHDLWREGELMHHCIGTDASYRNKMNSGEALFYSLRDSNGLPHVSMEVWPSGEIGEMFGRYDHEPKPEYKEMIGEWNREYDGVSWGRMNPVDEEREPEHAEEDDSWVPGEVMEIRDLDDLERYERDVSMYMYDYISSYENEGEIEYNNDGDYYYVYISGKTVNLYPADVMVELINAVVEGDDEAATQEQVEWTLKTLYLAMFHEYGNTYTDARGLAQVTKVSLSDLASYVQNVADTRLNDYYYTQNSAPAIQDDRLFEEQPNEGERAVPIWYDVLDAIALALNNASDGSTHLATFFSDLPFVWENDTYGKRVPPVEEIPSYYRPPQLQFGRPVPIEQAQDDEADDGMGLPGAFSTWEEYAADPTLEYMQ